MNYSEHHIVVKFSSKRTLSCGNRMQPKLKQNIFLVFFIRYFVLILFP